MGSMRRFGTSLVIAAVMACGVGSASLEAQGKKKPGGNEAICTYLAAVMAYENVSPYIYAWAAALYDYFGCPK